jgi:transglutaminase-like putative cysteine protease
MRRNSFSVRLLNIAVMTCLLIMLSVFCCAAEDDLQICSSVSDASDVIREAMKDREETMDVCLITDIEAEDSEDLINEIFEGALEHTGEPTEGDYLRFQYNTCSASAKPVWAGGEDAILFTYEVTYYDTAEQEEAVDDKVSGILESLELDDMTDYDKLVTIYNYICGNVEYDYDHYKDDNYHLKHTAYGALIDGKSVCQGYSLALYRLLLEAGIDNRIIFGTSTGSDGEQGSHTWNIVRVGDRYYNTDVTGDAGSQIRAFYLKGSGDFDEDHVRNEDYLTDEFTSEYNVSDSDYVVDALMERIAALTDSLKAAAKRVSAALKK